MPAGGSCLVIELEVFHVANKSSCRAAWCEISGQRWASEVVEMRASSLGSILLRPPP